MSQPIGMFAIVSGDTEYFVEASQVVYIKTVMVEVPGEEEPARKSTIFLKHAGEITVPIDGESLWRKYQYAIKAARP